MKKILLLIAILLLFAVVIKAQNKNPVDTTVYTNAEVQPTFPGGMQKLYQFITENLKPTGDKGFVPLSFIVEKDGSLSHIAVGRHLSDSADKEAVRVMSTSPKWTPATTHGNQVRLMYTIPIRFN